MRYLTKNFCHRWSNHKWKFAQRYFLDMKANCTRCGMSEQELFTRLRQARKAK